MSGEQPSMISLFIKLMKLRVIVLLQITAICAILVHDSLARYDLIDLERTWSDTLWTSLVTLAGGTLSAGGSNAINMWYDRDIDTKMRRTQNDHFHWVNFNQQRCCCLESSFRFLGRHCSSCFIGRLHFGPSFRSDFTCSFTRCG